MSENKEMINQLETLASSWERRFKSAEEIPEDLIPFLNKRYNLEDNVYNLSAVEFKYENRKLICLTYNDYFINTYTVGIGEYLTSKNSDLSDAMAAGFSSQDSFEMRRIAIGGSFWEQYKIYFDGNGIRISVEDSEGHSFSLKGQASRK